MTTNTKTALIVTLWSVFQAGKKHYTTVSIDRLIDLLDTIHNVKVKRRWIFYCLRDFLDEGLILRQSRYQQGDKNEIRQIPSLISFSLKGLKYLVKNKVSGAFGALKSMIAWIKGKDQRFPHNEDKLPDLSLAERQDNLKKLKLLFQGIGN